MEAFKAEPNRNTDRHVAASPLGRITRYSYKCLMCNINGSDFSGAAS